MIDTIGNALLKSNATTVEEAKEVETSEGTIGELIVEKTAKIGEKLSLRRFEILTKIMMNILEHTFIWVEKLQL